MNVSESGLAELYRNLGREVPPGLSVDSPAAAPRKEKYGRVKKEVDGIVFDSTLEAEAYKILKLWECSGAIRELELQPTYMLQDGFRDLDGKWNRAIKYQADFAFRRGTAPDIEMVVVDAKGIQTPAFRIKAKLFRARWPGIDLQIWDKAKVREFSRC